MKAAAIVTLAACFLVSAGCGGQPKRPQEPFPEQVTDFHELFSRHCVGCHGADGMKGPGPRLNDPLYLAVADRDITGHSWLRGLAPSPFGRGMG